MLNRIPKYCHIARAFGNDAAEAKRQLPIWRKNGNVGIDWTVHLYHTKSRGWAIMLCSPDYRGKR